MKTLLIVYHSHTGGSRQMAEAAAAGAWTEDALTVRLLHAPEAASADVLGADGYLFVTPENLGGMAGLMKDFFDRTYYGALGRVAAGRMPRSSVPAATARARRASSNASPPAGGSRRSRRR